jgi:two-component system, chemotaxis family, protein-glutamate methylesterase/glutaminase
MSAILIASPQAFLRIGLAQQLRRAVPGCMVLEAASAAESARLLAAGSGIALAIIDDALLAAGGTQGFGAALARHGGPLVMIATSEAPAVLPAGAGPCEIIAGSVDGVLSMGAIMRALPAALDTLSASVPRRRAPPPASVPDPGDAARAGRPEIALIAASTGGPGALTALLRHLGAAPLPIVVAQHMPADQTSSFAQHLAAETGLAVVERGSGELQLVPQVTVLRGGADYRLTRGRRGGLRLVATEMAGNVFHPSADLLFASAAEAGLAAVAVVLSGMGDDGARGACAIVAHGGRVLVQDFASCVVPGMPSAAHAACPQAAIASLSRIAAQLARLTASPARAALAAAGG